jgi:hypothetical protein
MHSQLRVNRLGDHQRSVIRVHETELEQNDEWAVQRARYMTLETIAALSDDPIVALPCVRTYLTVAILKAPSLSRESRRRR